MFGSGHYTQIWNGDNMATWEFLTLSISGIFNMNLFSMPMAGPDICGFGGDTTP